MLNGLDLFSGIGGITLALADWVRPVAYCEIDPYAQRVLASRMSERRLPIAPIWDDVRTLSASVLPAKPDIIYGGFPCQDISVAGHGVGLAGKRSGLFFEIIRLAREIQPPFLFLENVPAIRCRGLDLVLKEIADCGYDCRWTNLSAREVGAWHKRDRWWFLAYSKSSGRAGELSDLSSENEKVKKSQELHEVEARKLKYASTEPQFLAAENASNSNSSNVERQRQESSRIKEKHKNTSDNNWWSTEPNVDRVVNGLPSRVDRIKCLGNAVVPEAARQAFMILSGLDIEKLNSSEAKE